MDLIIFGLAMTTLFKIATGNNPYKRIHRQEQGCEVDPRVSHDCNMCKCSVDLVVNALSSERAHSNVAHMFQMVCAQVAATDGQKLCLDGIDSMLDFGMSTVQIFTENMCMHACGAPLQRIARSRGTKKMHTESLMALHKAFEHSDPTKMDSCSMCKMGMDAVRNAVASERARSDMLAMASIYCDNEGIFAGACMQTVKWLTSGVHVGAQVAVQSACAVQCDFPQFQFEPLI